MKFFLLTVTCSQMPASCCYYAYDSKQFGPGCCSVPTRTCNLWWERECFWVTRLGCFFQYYQQLGSVSPCYAVFISNGRSSDTCYVFWSSNGLVPQVILILNFFFTLLVLWKRHEWLLPTVWLYPTILARKITKECTQWACPCTDR